ncbi:MAG: substrate-binding domain-containing protein [Vicinamibacterales bacterium]|nr:substrate-binding domain-containing protein [Vicinamibacterales bacterium]
MRDLTWIVLLMFAVAPLGAADELTVMSSGGYTAALQQLAAGFEKTTGHHVRLLLGPSMGTAPDAIPNRLARGETADLLVMVGSVLRDLIAKGVVRADSRVDLANSKIGMAVRAGQPRPDIGTIESFTRVLLAARSIAYSDSASGVYIETEMYKRLGFEAQLAAKSRRIIAERVGDVVARGDAEIGFQQVSELLPISGISFVGTIPGPVQRITLFSAGIPVAAPRPDLARQLLAYVTAASARAIVERTGMEPLP